MHRPDRIVLLLTGFLVLFPAAARAGQFYFHNSIDLLKVELYEMGLSDEGVPVALSPFETDATWDGGTLMTPDLQLDEVYTTAKISRRDVLLWYYDYAFWERKPAFNVRYRLLSRGGSMDAFSHETDNSSLIKARITEKAITCENRGYFWFRCFGVVDLDFDIATAKKSGNYYGTIEITIISY